MDEHAANIPGKKSAIGSSSSCPALIHHAARGGGGRDRGPSGPLSRALAALAAVVVLAAACTSASGPTSSPSPPPRPGPAWLAVLGQIRDDGTVSKETALEAFSLAFGPLPGVRVPSGDPGTIRSGTAALRWLVGHWKDITPEQRAAAARFVPELQGLEPPPPGSGGVGLGVIAASQLAAELPALAASQKRSNYFYTNFAEQVAQEIASRVGRSLGIPIEARVGLAGNAYAATGVYASSGGSSAPGKCVIVVSPTGDALIGDDLGSVIAHEVWHCFEGAVNGLAWYWSISPAWIDEGEAEWVGDSLYPSAPLDQGFWPGYLSSPQVSLFKRSYDAVGFYSQLDSSGTDVWSKLIPILQAKGNAGAFSAAGADGDQFLNVWASGYLRMPQRGSAWDITGPGVTSDRADVPFVQVPNGQTVKAEAKPYSNAIFGIDGASAADVLVFSFSGHARVSDDAGHDYLVQGDVTLCRKDGGCECPGGGSDQAPLSPLAGGGMIALAVTGDPGGDTGAVTGMSLDEFCKGSLTGTWVGRYAIGGEANWGFTMVLVQTGNKVTGTGEVTGPTCVRDQTITGTVAGSHVHLVEQGERDVTLDGTVEGNSMSGTWTAISCGPPFGSPNIPIDGTWQASRVK